MKFDLIFFCFLFACKSPRSSRSPPLSCQTAAAQLNKVPSLSSSHSAIRLISSLERTSDQNPS